MALNNVPVAGQTLGSSRDLINQNFAVINTAFSVNHVPYNDGSGNQGFHQFVQMPAGTPTKATTGTAQIALYSKNGATSTVPELYFQRNNLAADSGYAITEGTNAAQGWTRLPSGIMMKWGFGTINSNTYQLFTFAGLGATGPAFGSLTGPTNRVYCIQITQTGVNGFNNQCMQVGDITNAGFSVFSRAIGLPVPNNVPFQWLAIGIE